MNDKDKPQSGGFGDILSELAKTFGFELPKGLDGISNFSMDSLKDMAMGFLKPILQGLPVIGPLLLKLVDTVDTKEAAPAAKAPQETQEFMKGLVEDVSKTDPKTSQEFGDRLAAEIDARKGQMHFKPGDLREKFTLAAEDVAGPAFEDGKLTPEEKAGIAKKLAVAAGDATFTPDTLAPNEILLHDRFDGPGMSYGAPLPISAAGVHPDFFAKSFTALSIDEHGHPVEAGKTTVADLKKLMGDDLQIQQVKHDGTPTAYYISNPKGEGIYTHVAGPEAPLEIGNLKASQRQEMDKAEAPLAADNAYNDPVQNRVMAQALTL